MDHQIAIRDKLAERYLLNELDDRVREDFEEHYFTCERCAEDVRQGARFIENTRSVFEEEAAAPAPRTAPTRHEWLRWIWNPLPAYALAAALALAVIVQRSPDGALVQQPRAISAVELRPATRGTPQTVRVAPDAGVVELMVGVAAGKSYRCTITNRQGEVLSVIETPVVQTSQLILLIPPDQLRNGPFRLSVRSESGAGEAFTEDYEFTTEP